MHNVSVNYGHLNYCLQKSSDAKNSNRAVVNGRFLKQLFQILKIVIPGFTSAEFGLLLLVAGSLVARSYSDIWMIQTGTIVETAIVSMDKVLFKKQLLYFFAGMPIVSKMLNYLLKFNIQNNQY